MGDMGSDGFPARSGRDQARPRRPRRRSGRRLRATRCPRRSTAPGRHPSAAPTSRSTAGRRSPHGVERVNPDYVRAQLRQRVPGATVTAEQVTADTERVYELGDFERVDYRFAARVEQRDLEISVTEKSWGPSSAACRLRSVDATKAATSTRSFGAITIALGSMSTGRRWHNALQIGRRIAAHHGFLPTDRRPPAVLLAADSVGRKHVRGHLPRRRAHRSNTACASSTAKRISA